MKKQAKKPGQLLMEKVKATKPSAQAMATPLTSSDPEYTAKVAYASEVLIQEWRPTWRGDLIGLGDHFRDLILEITANPKPDYKLKNDSYSWGEYLDILMKSYGAIQGLLFDLDRFEYQRPYWYRAEHRSHYHRWF